MDFDFINMKMIQMSDIFYENGVTSILNVNDKILIALYSGNKILSYENRKLNNQSDEIETLTPIDMIHINSNKVAIASAGQNKSQIYDLESKKMIFEKTFEYSPLTFCKVDNTNCLIGFYYTGEIKLWNTKKNKIVSTLKAHGNHINSIIKLGKNNSNLYASLSWDGTIKIWSLEKFEIMNEIISKRFDSDVLQDNHLSRLKELNDGRLASSNNENSVLLYDLRSNSHLLLGTAYNYPLFDILQVSDNFIITSSHNCIRKWDLRLPNSEIDSFSFSEFYRLEN
jgi:WD40 repeat protein